MHQRDTIITQGQGLHLVPRNVLLSNFVHILIKKLAFIMTFKALMG